MKIEKGREYTLTTKFTYRGSPAVFNTPPKWNIYNSEDVLIQTGVASPSGSVWGASFTIPTNYVVIGGKEDLILQFTGIDNRNASYTVDKNLELIDEDEGFTPNGVVYNAVSNSAVTDVLFADTASLLTLSIQVINPLGEAVGEAITSTNVLPDSSSTRGNLFKFTLPALDIAQNTWNDPFQIIITYTTAENNVEVEIHPLHILDRRTLTFVQRLKLSLDKSQIIEIDDSLQWHLPEYIESVLSGLKKINSVEPENTFWTLKDAPSSLDSYILIASQIAALEMRYMAEGFNAFEFNGLNTTLNYNRTDFLANKIGELNSMLDRLPAAKKSAINVAGKGTPPVGENDVRVKNVGVLGLTVNPLNNRVVNRPYYRFQ